MKKLLFVLFVMLLMAYPSTQPSVSDTILDHQQDVQQIVNERDQLVAMLDNVVIDLQQLTKDAESVQINVQEALRLFREYDRITNNTGYDYVSLMPLYEIKRQ